MVSHLAKYRMRTHGDVDMPVTVRIPSFGGIGAVEHHSESTETYWAHTAGLKVVVPSTPSDAYWLLRHSIASRDPVIYLEPKRRYWSREDVDTSEPGLPIGRAAIRRIGDDVTVLTYGGLVQTALAAADLAADQYGWNLEVVDLRSLNPLDFDTVAASVRKTGRAVVMHEGARTLGFGAELAARIQEELFYDLESPVLRATGFDTPYPPARLEKLWLPGVDRLLDCVEKAMALMTGEGVRDFLVPDLGEGLEDATITGWSVAVGDEVELNQTLCTVETNKAEVEIPSPYAGRIVELGGAEGDTLAVGAVLVRIATDSPAPVSRNGGGPARKPVLVGYGADDEMDTSRRAPVEDGTRPRAKPPVRKLAAELRVDLAALAPGSGPDGIVTREDVLAAAGKAGEGSDTVGVHGVQATMAQRMTLSRSQIPDAHASVQVDCSALLRVRDRLREAVGDDGPQITPFVLTLRLLTIALTHHPMFNSTWVDTAGGPHIHIHSAVHLGFGVAAPRGLLVPVVKDAQDKTTRELAATVSRLIDEARAGTVKPAELQGSTFTVSNFGALGLDEGVPVINYPEAAILGMGSLKPRPVVVDGCRGRSADDDADVRLRPPHRRRCAGGRVPR